MINASWWPVVEQRNDDVIENNNETDNNGLVSWTEWIPCFERDNNENDIAEPILVGPDTPTEEVCII